MAKSIVHLPKLYDAGGDLKKDWFVSYSVRDPKTGVMKRFREYEGINRLHTHHERYALAEKMIDNLMDKLATGWSPFDREKIAYRDELVLQAQADRWGRERSTLPTIRINLSEFLDSKKQTIIAHSFQTYRSKLRIFAEWAEKNKLDTIHVSCITRDHIIAFLSYMVEHQNISRRTVLKYRQILHGFFDFLIDVKQAVTKNPVQNIPNMGRLTDEAARPIPEKERSILTRYLRKNDPQLWLLCMMEYYCAIRPNELRQLKLGDIDLQNGVVRVPCTISKNRLTESISIPNQLAKVLQAMKIDEMDRNWFLFSKDKMPGAVMLGKNNMRFRFDRIRQRLGLSDDFKLYSFKHTGGVELVNAGIDTWELQRHMRHKSIDTTERYVRRNFAVRSDKIKNHFPDL